MELFQGEFGGSLSDDIVWRIVETFYSVAAEVDIL